MEHCIQYPELMRVKELLEEYLDRDFVVQLNGLCEVHYQGRAKSSLDRGERLVLVKEDNALLVHGPDKYQPRNWQPSVDSWKVRLNEDGDQLILEALRKKPEEIVEITFDDIDLIVVNQMVDRAELRLRGHEVDIHEAIEEDPSLVEDGLVVVEREKKTAAGYIDVFARDRSNRFVVIEVKRNPDHNTVMQLQRYIDEIDDEYAGSIRGMIVAPKISDSLLEYLIDKGFEYVEIDMADVITSYKKLDRQRTLDGF